MSQCPHAATIAHPDDDMAVMRCVACGEKVTWLKALIATEKPKQAS